MRCVAAERHLALPDGEIARQHCLRPDTVAPDLATTKDFVCFYIATSLTPNKPSKID
jgi:hypothetical protein